MGLFDWLFKRNSIKQLPVGNNNAKTNYHNTRNSWIVKPQIPIYEPTLEECIVEFINQYKFQSELSSGKLPYHSFRSMFATKEEPVKNNEKQQRKLMNHVRNTNGLHTSFQQSGDRTVFLHISGEEGIDEKSTDMEKLYINCSRENIAKLSLNILQTIYPIVGNKLQMKYIAEQVFPEGKEYEKTSPIKNYQRNDKIIVYAQNHEMAEILAGQINQLRLKKPELFSTSVSIPLMPKKYGFIGISKKLPSEHAKTPVGTASGKTYNDYISDLLYQCIVSGFDMNFEVNYSTEKSTPSERMEQYAICFDQMPAKDRAAIIQSSKEIFECICKENNVNTIYTPSSRNYNSRNYNSRNFGDQPR